MTAGVEGVLVDNSAGVHVVRSSHSHDLHVQRVALYNVHCLMKMERLLSQNANFINVWL